MVKKKVDPRVKSLIESGVQHNHRSLFILVGDHGKDQVENIHRILSSLQVKARPSVLWCYKNDLGFSTHRKKRMKEIKTMQARGLYDNERDDPFDLFISSTNIRWTYYKETDKVMGQTFGMCVLQDFEALTPNILARTIETVEGGGVVILLIKTVSSLKQLYTLTMDVHSRFRTEAQGEIVPRFNERFILSLAQCPACLVLDDELNVLPISSKVAEIVAAAGEARGDAELAALKQSLIQTPQVGALVEQTRTVDQARAVMSFLDTISDKMLRTTVSLTAGRGRGKSAALGLCLSGAVAFGYANIFVTAPSPEQLSTCFAFLLQGLQCLGYSEHRDFEVVYSAAPEVAGGRLVTRVNIFKARHRQVVQYVLPHESSKLVSAELLVIDEAAAIPLPVVKQLLGPYVVLLASTVNGYEGTGRALSLKLLSQLRQQQGRQMLQQTQQSAAAVGGAGVAGKHKGERQVHEARWKAAAESAKQQAQSQRPQLVELTLAEPIRYGKNDPVERWLHDLLCLDSADKLVRITAAMPAPRDCELYLVDRDALFSQHPLAENFLQRVWALYTAAHYKNSPNDLQMLSDAPAHRLFVLLGPRGAAASASLPDVLCVVQVAFEGRISAASVQAQLARGNKASGDLIPWTLSQQFCESRFASLSGARVVRIATHPDLQSMGYGSRALELLVRYFQGELSQSLDESSAGDRSDRNTAAAFPVSAASGEGLQAEEVAPRGTLPPLLTPLSERPCERLHWLGTSFGLTGPLLDFWSRKDFRVVYLRQSASETTGEHSCIVLRELDCADLQSAGSPVPRGGWLEPLAEDYRRRLVSLLGFAFRTLPVSLGLSLLDPQKKLTAAHTALSNAAAEAEDAESAAPGASSSSPGMSAELLLSAFLTHHDLQRLELYARSLVDHHVILDLLPVLARIFFLRLLAGSSSAMRLSFLQAAILLGTGLQHKEVEALCTELDLPANQVLAFFNKSMRKLASALRVVVEAAEDRELLVSRSQALRIELQSQRSLQPLQQTLKEEQRAHEADFRQQKQQQQQLLAQDQELKGHALGAQTMSLLDRVAAKHQDGEQSATGIVSVPKERGTVSAGVEKESEKEKKHGKDKHKKDKRRHDEREEEPQNKATIGESDNSDGNDKHHHKKKKHKHSQ